MGKEKISRIESVRKRPGMYFGSIDSLGVNVAIYELVANVIDQYLAGNVTKLSVQIDVDKITISDNGRGLPFDEPSLNPEYTSLAESFLLYSHDAPTADNHAPHIHLFNTNGLGLAIVNAASKYMNVKSYNSSYVWEELFGQGKVLKSAVKKESTHTQGTVIEMQLDEEMFSDTKPEMLSLRKTLFEVAHFYPGLIVEFLDETFIAHQGLLDLAYIYYSPTCAGHSPITFFYQGILDDVQMQVALIDETGDDTEYFSWVNGSVLVDGGTHIAGLKEACRAVNWKPKTALIHVIMHNPEFAGPVRSKLKSLEIKDVIKKMLKEPLEKYRQL